MTCPQLAILDQHPDPLVRQLSRHYADLWDSTSDLLYLLTKHSPDSEEVANALADLIKVMQQQPAYADPKAKG